MSRVLASGSGSQKKLFSSLTEIENEPLGEPPFLLKLKQFKKWWIKTSKPVKETGWKSS